ncbi:hypothetical protein AcV5_004763 [Taiwanofungus camphoratus]|nr:hypothetical protein AcV5_004763 [Antrodia cinnamomea]
MCGTPHYFIHVNPFWQPSLSFESPIGVVTRRRGQWRGDTKWSKSGRPITLAVLRGLGHWSRRKSFSNDSTSHPYFLLAPIKPSASGAHLSQFQAEPRASDYIQT